MREADNKSWSIFLSVVGVMLIEHQVWMISIVANFSEKLPVLFFFLLLSISTVNLSCLLATTFSSLRFLFNSLSSPRFNLLRVARAVSHGFLFSHFRFLSSILSLYWHTRHTDIQLITRVRVEYVIVINQMWGLYEIYKSRDSRAKPEWQGFMNRVQSEHWFITVL